MSSPHSFSDSVVVVGGGLAGIAAAVRAAQAGVAVTLVETRLRLGGRATSFVDPTTGHVLDNCQHVLLGCCTNLIDLYRRLGVADRIEWHRRLLFTDGQGGVDVMEADDLPAPLHMTGSLLKFRGLTWGEKLAIAKGMRAVMRVGRAERERLHEISFAQWLSEQSQPAGAVEKFWSVITISALNETPERAAADYALQVFQEGFLAHEEAYVMGVSAVPLVRLYDAAQQAIEAAGGRVLLSTSAEKFVFDGRQVTGLKIDGGRTVEGQAFVSAVPADRLAKLATDPMRAADARLQGLEGFEPSPIIGIHLWLECEDGQPVMEWPHVIFTSGPLQWVFSKGMGEWEGSQKLEVRSQKWEGEEQDPRHLGDPSPRPSPGGRGGKPLAQHLHGVISAAQEWVGKSAEEIAGMAVEELRRVAPGTRGAKVLHVRVVKEKRATFSACPGIAKLRAAARGAIGNLYLAGDWCDTGWPATMEGATRSGYSAAGAMLEDWGRMAEGETALVADLEASWLYRMLSR